MFSSLTLFGSSFWKWSVFMQLWWKGFV